MEKMYDCKCGRCGSDFKSDKELDTDGEGKCPDCMQKHLALAKKVEENLAVIRANRPQQVENPLDSRFSLRSNQ